MGKVKNLNISRLIWNVSHLKIFLQGHGEYTEIPEEKEFFEVSKKSGNVVCHFYRDDFFRCKVVDKHLAILARKHMETKFVKINAEKCPFLTGVSLLFSMYGMIYFKSGIDFNILQVP